MSLPIILMVAGCILMAVSFFFSTGNKKLSKEMEDLSITVFQETNALKKRLRIVEEELLLEPQFQVKKPQQKSSSFAMPTTYTEKPIHDILKSQVMALQKQGLSIHEISVRSTLTEEQVKSVIANGGR
ncbi:hypothetical protein GCM10007425_10430 [Lysinibacillus alkalisoli]|uniref:Uncharacterized protein n=1 Tax=Lysinibacillus alkalisoli TaxID=1911548 RepID=A0A917LF76_9BACI|nr:hypothetical protein [Lysinibacillus alkalisoli]GGG17931.1 hypothetical protein GCM10007425_10430 [Lysinibacillus alkalisoli]